MALMSIRRSHAAAPSVAVLALVVAGCGNDDTASPSHGPTVLASFYPLAYVAERVAAPDGIVENLTQPGVEPHDLELTGQQVGSIADADLVLYLHGFQPAVDEAVEQNAHDHSLDVAETVDLLPAAEEESHEDEDGDHGDVESDPHVWLDPDNLAAISQAVDEEFDTGLAQCERRVFVTSHEAFGYLADRYDLEQVGISGLSPDAEPSPARLAEVQEVVRAEGVTTIFYETLVSPKVAETMAEDLDLATAVLDPIEGLSDDTAEEDYLTQMRANLDAL